MTISIDAKTKRVQNANEHEPQMYSEWLPEWNVRWNTTPGYIRGWTKPNFPMPAIRTQVNFYYYSIVLSEFTPTFTPRLMWWLKGKRRKLTVETR